MSAANRNDWIDLLRALGAVAVVLFHFNVVPQTLPPGEPARVWHDFWQYGHLGVGVFFALSGYCLVPGWNRSPGFIEFVRRRVLRIMPPYWCSLLLVVILAGIFKYANGVNDIASLPRSAGSIFATLLLLTSPVTTVPTINWVYWTLSYLLAFYLLLALPLLGPVRRRIPILAGLHVLLCTIDLAARPAAVGAGFFIRHWPVFGLGVALALWPLHRRPACLMLGVSAIHALWTIGRGLDETHYMVTGCLTAVTLLATTNRPAPAWLHPLALIGRISYSVYLVHVPVGICILFRLLPLRFLTTTALISSQLGILAAVLAFAGLYYLACERPFNAALGRPTSP